MITDILMTIAAFGFTFSIVPQILLLFKTKTANDVSLARNFIILICVGLTVYADIRLNLLFATIMNSIQIILCVTVIAQIKFYRRKIQ